MSQLWIDVDDAALTAAGDLLGTETPQDTINTALRLTCADRRRRLAEEAAAGHRTAGDPHGTREPRGPAAPRA
ncbi:DUF2191 domain-containing protein [Allostreptomyces psammosilenae]|uniref:Arc/MetJ family transcription regulator n=1 Tax=Allostreptomyces psammosilenae TaxID=1892865 RepID=A0A853A839_9ACTN|nr:DUF2191 domain-containing protein [Allostreptomyces psammosilenae]NYI06698.1 Arc/MetJ family transcription regulator [Allostreptomyces psammosilenae]